MKHYKVYSKKQVRVIIILLLLLLLLSLLSLLLLGEIQSIKLWTDIQLVEYRSIFEKFNASSIYCLPSLLQNSHESKFAYKLFLQCQGKSLDMMKRVEVIKARISKYKLSKSQSVEISMIMQERSQLNSVHTGISSSSSSSSL